MNLAAQQQAFLAAILDEGAPLPAGWGERHRTGMAVYRGNYRSALMEALAQTFPRTEALAQTLAAPDAFRQASINHVIARPPAHWTIDAAGEGFDQTCAAFLPESPAVAELAWLEWVMLEAANGPDCAALGPQDFARASAGFGDAEWLALRLAFQPRATVRMVAHDLTALWRADGASEPAHLEEPQGCLVWREGERPTFKLVSPATARVFAAMQAGGTYGEAITLIAGENPRPQAVGEAAALAGAMLGDWLNEGLVIGTTP